jgi:hypothetical protein
MLLISLSHTIILCPISFVYASFVGLTWSPVSFFQRELSDCLYTTPIHGWKPDPDLIWDQILILNQELQINFQDNFFYKRNQNNNQGFCSISFD